MPEGAEVVLYGSSLRVPPKLQKESNVREAHQHAAVATASSYAPGRRSSTGNEQTAELRVTAHGQTSLGDSRAAQEVAKDRRMIADLALDGVVKARQEKDKAKRAVRETQLALSKVEAWAKTAAEEADAAEAEIAAWAFANNVRSDSQAKCREMNEASTSEYHAALDTPADLPSWLQAESVVKPPVSEDDKKATPSHCGDVASLAETEENPIIGDEKAEAERIARYDKWKAHHEAVRAYEEWRVAADQENERLEEEARRVAEEARLRRLQHEEKQARVREEALRLQILQAKAVEAEKARERAAALAAARNRTRKQLLEEEEMERQARLAEEEALRLAQQRKLEAMAQRDLQRKMNEEVITMIKKSGAELKECNNITLVESIRRAEFAPSQDEESPVYPENNDFGFSAPATELVHYAGEDKGNGRESIASAEPQIPPEIAGNERQLHNEKETASKPLRRKQVRIQDQHLPQGSSDNDKETAGSGSEASSAALAPAPARSPRDHPWQAFSKQSAHDKISSERRRLKGKVDEPQLLVPTHKEKVDGGGAADDREARNELRLLSVSKSATVDTQYNRLALRKSVISNKPSSSESLVGLNRRDITRGKTNTIQTTLDLPIARFTQVDGLERVPQSFAAPMFRFDEFDDESVSSGGKN